MLFRSLAFFPAEGAVWMPTITLTVYLGVNWWASWYPGAEPGGGGYVAQRIFSARSERDGVLATLWFNIAHYAVRPWPWILVALASTVLYPGLDDPKEGYVRAVMDLLPPGLTGLVLAGFAAAYMSTISTQLNWGASYLVNDLYARFVRPDLDERRLVGLSRVVVLVLVVVSTLLGLAEWDLVFWFVLLAWAGLGAALGPTSLLALYWRRTTLAGVAAGMVAGGVTTFVWRAWLKEATEIGRAHV